MNINGEFDIPVGDITTSNTFDEISFVLPQAPTQSGHISVTAIGGTVESAEIFYQIKRDICMTCLLISIYKKSFEVLCFPCISTFAITKQPVVVVVNNENLLDVNHEIVFLGSAYSLIFLIPIYTPLYILLHFHQSH